MTVFTRPRWMNTRFGGSDSNPEKRDADLVAMIDALAERVARLEATVSNPENVVEQQRPCGVCWQWESFCRHDGCSSAETPKVDE